MNLGTIAGKILFGLGGLFFCMFIYGINSYAEIGGQYIFIGAALSSFVFGVICNEIGKCSEALEKSERVSASALKTSQDILTELRKVKISQDSKEFHDAPTEKQCAKCGTAITNDATKCPHCGEVPKWGW